jgi:hypothetical protein
MKKGKNPKRSGPGSENKKMTDFLGVPDLLGKRPAPDAELESP